MLDYKDQSNKIQNILLSIPDISLSMREYCYYNDEKKHEFIAPIIPQLESLNLRLDDIKEVLNEYSIIMNYEKIEEQLTEILSWLFVDQRQDPSGGWPLARLPQDSNRYNAWANAICILALLKFRHFGIEKIQDNYNEKIHKSVEWLLDPSQGIYCPGNGWKHEAGGLSSKINVSDTCIAIRAILKYRSYCKKEKLLYDYDHKIISIIAHLLQDLGQVGVIEQSHLILTLAQYYNVFIKEDENNPMIISAQNALLGLLISIMSSYGDGKGWADSEGNPSLEHSCYANQAIAKCRTSFPDKLKETNYNGSTLWGNSIAITAAEIERLQNCFIYQHPNWGWPLNCEQQNVHLINTALATATLLKCGEGTSMFIDLSIILKSVNYLLKVFDRERMTLENTYILCAIMDYMFYRMRRRLAY